MNIRYESEKTIITDANIQLWGMAKDQKLELFYIVETTKEDKEIEEINFSNIHREECKNIQEAIKRMNYFQSMGWHNINIETVVKHNNEQIISDISEPQLEYEMNSGLIKEYKKENNELKKQLQTANDEIHIYESFITRYKADKALEKFIDEEYNKEPNKDQNGLYWYEMTLRPLSPFCQPKNHIQYDETKGRHGIVAYDRPLTASELDEYELRVWTA